MNYLNNLPSNYTKRKYTFIGTEAGSETAGLIFLLRFFLSFNSLSCLIRRLYILAFCSNREVYASLNFRASVSKFIISGFSFLLILLSTHPETLVFDLVKIE